MIDGETRDIKVARASRPRATSTSRKELNSRPDSPAPYSRVIAARAAADRPAGRSSRPSVSITGPTSTCTVRVWPVVAPTTGMSVIVYEPLAAGSVVLIVVVPLIAPVSKSAVPAT